MPSSKQSLSTKAAVLCISLMLTSAPAINGALPAMRESLHISTTQNELLSTIPSLAVIVFILISSWVERKLGTKRTICLALVLAGIGGAAPMILSTYPLIFASRLVLGCGLGLYNSLAVSIINELYTGDTRATMLGFRSSTESLGQSVLTIFAGLLLALGWHWSYAIYLLTFPIAVIFYLVVPDPKPTNPVAVLTEPAQESAQVGAAPSSEKAAEAESKEKLNPFVWLLVLFAVFMVLNSLCSTLRFPSIAVGIKGDGYNASFFLSLMPILGILAGFVFGFLNRTIGKAVLYMGIALYLVGNIMMSLSGNNFVLGLVGMMIIGIPGSWCFPYIYTTLGDITGPKTSTFATSLILIGCNVGNFISPIFMQGVASALRTDSLTAPFNVLAVIFGAILVGVLVWDLSRKSKARRA
ncbi:MFS transporter [Bombiscardovia nodaiensis]|uniref:MFS transporter n=1 Tax=Bombiscardovia nodaiensis TaxID=2932181 RepID=A0ABN6SBS6_9BIFI|nr:MFS transporter [Bombiscardovia nodaiensis]